MKIDRTTKVILAAIAVGLFLNAAMPLMRPKTVRAGQPFSCTGDLHANAWGGIEPTIGGYRVQIQCSDSGTAAYIDTTSPISEAQKKAVEGK